MNNVKLKKILSPIVAAVLILCLLAVYVLAIYPTHVKPREVYNEAVRLYEAGDYVCAALRFELVRGSWDSDELRQSALMRAADAAFASGELDKAYAYYRMVNADEAKLAELDEAYFARGSAEMANGDWRLAEVHFGCISDDALSNRINDARLGRIRTLIQTGQLADAKTLSYICGAEAHERLYVAWYDAATASLDASELEHAYLCFSIARSFVSDGNLSAFLGEVENAWNSTRDGFMNAGEYELAAKCVAMCGSFMRVSDSEVDSERYTMALGLYNEGKYLEALLLLNTLNDAGEDAQELIQSILSLLKRMPAGGGDGFYAMLGLDGVVTLYGGAWQNTDIVSGWENINSVSVGKEPFILGLRADGTVVGAGVDSLGRIDVGGWSGITQIACGQYHSLGLTQDGRVLSCGWNYNGQSMTGAWSDIVYIAVGYSTSYGITSTGRVVAIGENTYGQCDTGAWEGITSVSAGENHAVGLRDDGTVVACGSNSYGQCNVAGWSDIVAVSAGRNHTIGLKSDGTVVACGSNANGECTVSGYANVIAVSALGGGSILVLGDGTCIVLGSAAADR